MAVPTRTMVDPSSMAISKSSDMPMERMSISTFGMLCCCICCWIDFNRRKHFLASSGSDDSFPMVMSPLMFNVSSLATCSINGITSSGATPNLLSSYDVFTCMSMLIWRPSFVSRLCRRLASRMRSTECMNDVYRSTWFTLFVCKWPMKWMSACSWLMASYFSCSSWARLSPINVSPAVMARLMFSGVTVFVASNSFTSSGFRPDFWHALVILLWICCKFVSTCILSKNSTSFLCVVFLVNKREYLDSNENIRFCRPSPFHLVCLFYHNVVGNINKVILLFFYFYANICFGLDRDILN